MGGTRAAVCAEIVAAVYDRRICVIPTEVEESLPISEIFKDISTPLDMTSSTSRRLAGDRVSAANAGEHFPKRVENAAN